MAGNHVLKGVIRLLLPLTLVLLANPVLPADAVGANSANLESGNQLDELVIEGKRLYQLRKEIVEAEDRFFKLYNALNTDDDFDVHCAREASLGSRITQRVCRADFYAAAETEYAVAMFQGYYAPPPELVALQRRDEYRAKALALINRHPDLLRLLRRRDDLERAYIKTRKERFKDHWVQF